MSEVLLGKLTSTTGIFTAGDVEEIDTRWSGANGGSSGWVLDIIGPNAAYLAGRQRGSASKLEELSDGTYRLHFDSQLTAQTIQSDTMTCVGANGWRDQVRASSRGATRLGILDAARADGAGVMGNRLAGLLVEPGKAVQVFGVKDASGKVVELRLRPV
jgi:hypothetical protein